MSARDLFVFTFIFVACADNISDRNFAFEQNDNSQSRHTIIGIPDATLLA